MQIFDRLFALSDVQLVDAIKAVRSPFKDTENVIYDPSLVRTAKVQFDHHPGADALLIDYPR